MKMEKKQIFFTLSFLMLLSLYRPLALAGNININDLSNESIPAIYHPGHTSKINKRLNIVRPGQSIVACGYYRYQTIIKERERGGASNTERPLYFIIKYTPEVHSFTPLFDTRERCDIYWMFENFANDGTSNNRIILGRTSCNLAYTPFSRSRLEPIQRYNSLVYEIPFLEILKFNGFPYVNAPKGVQVTLIPHKQYGNARQKGLMAGDTFFRKYGRETLVTQEVEEESSIGTILSKKMTHLFHLDSSPHGFYSSLDSCELPAILQNEIGQNRRLDFQRLTPGRTLYDVLDMWLFVVSNPAR